MIKIISTIISTEHMRVYREEHWPVPLADCTCKNVYPKKKLCAISSDLYYL